uniref:Uncharacterized protein n=1 Tax=Xiphophorus couchianus TaxID=32473 RepID=A0A3B5LFJ2_9TELE
MAGGREEKDLVHLNAIHVENVKKERRYQKLHTEFSINPYRKSKLSLLILLHQNVHPRF